MINNIARVGNFTSSEIVALTKIKENGSFDKAALTYIEETNMERRLGRSLTEEVNARPLTWGKLLEQRVFELLGLEYIYLATETIVHPLFPYWAGSPDGEKNGDTITDTKCPTALKSFCQLVDPLYKGLEGLAAMNAIRKSHKDGEKFYWQLVSNAILKDYRFAELIVYMPYKSELPEVVQMAHNVPAEHLSRHYWIAMAQEDDLPYLVDGGYYKNLNVVRFEVPQEDKDFLTGRVLEAGKLLIGNTSPVYDLNKIPLTKIA
jgi:hypothetical protein